MDLKISLSTLLTSALSPVLPNRAGKRCIAEGSCFLIMASLIGFAAIPAALAFETLPVKVLSIDAVRVPGKKPQASDSAVFQELSKYVTRTLKADASKMPALVLQDLSHELDESKDMPKDSKLPQPKKTYPLQSPLNSTVCVLIGQMSFPGPKDSDDAKPADGAKQFSSASLDLRIVDLTTQEVIDTIHVDSELPKVENLPTVSQIRAKDFAKSATGTLVDGLVAQAISKLEAMAKDGSSKLSSFASKTKGAKSKPGAAAGK